MSCRSTSVPDLDIIEGVNKRCTKCKQVHPIESYHNDRGRKVARCRDCCALHMKEWYDKKNPERLLHPKIYGDEHKLIQGVSKRCTVCEVVKNFDEYNNLSASPDGKSSRCRVCTTKYCHENKQMYATLHKRWTNENRAKSRARGNKRRAQKRNATPDWLTEYDLLSMEQIYQQAITLQLITGQSYHVDHCVPLSGKIVCGLHVPWNLVPMIAGENIKKKNTLIESESISLTLSNEKSWLKLQGVFN